MNVGILTYHRALNYGAYLQACALCNRLNQEDDISAEIIDYQMVKEATHYKKNWNILMRFIHFPAYKFYAGKSNGFVRALKDPILKHSAEFLKSDSLESFQACFGDKYDVVIAGSDEIWNFNNFRGFPNAYWLPGDLKSRKFSYAASSRQDFSKLSAEQAKIMREYFQCFEYIGVRDQLTYDSIAEMMGSEERLHLCCDPSFLYDFEIEKKDLFHWNRLKLNPRKKNAFVMVTDRKLAFYLKKKLGASYNLISVCNRHPGLTNVADITPMEWLTILNSCDIILTTFFHATCFSMICRKPFISFGSLRSSKIEALLHAANMLDHYEPDTQKMIETDGLDKLLSKAEMMDGSAEYIDRERDNFRHFIAQLEQQK